MMTIKQTKHLLALVFILGWMQLGVVMAHDTIPAPPADPPIPPAGAEEPLATGESAVAAAAAVEAPEEDPDAVVVGFYIGFDAPSCDSTCNAAQTRRRLNLMRKVGRAGGFKWVDINSNWENMGRNEDSLVVADMECEEAMITEVNGISCEMAPDDEDYGDGLRRHLTDEDTIIEEMEQQELFQEHDLLHRLHQGERKLMSCAALQAQWPHLYDCYNEGTSGRRRRQRNLRAVPRMSRKKAAALPPLERLERMIVAAKALCLDKNIPCIDCGNAEVGLIYG